MHQIQAGKGLKEVKKENEKEKKMQSVFSADSFAVLHDAADTGTGGTGSDRNGKHSGRGYAEQKRLENRKG